MTDIEDEEDGISPAYKWSWLVLAGMAANLMGHVLRAGSNFCEELDEHVAAHITWQRDRTDFVKSVGWDIDHLTK